MKTQTQKPTEPGVVITPDLAECGAVSFWRLTGSMVLADLTTVWAAEGLDAKLLPAPPTDEMALGRAVHELAQKRRLVRPLAKRAAWAVVSEDVKDDKPSYTVEVKVYWHAKEARAGYVQGDGGWQTYQDHVTKIRAAFVRLKLELSSEDVSAWLVGLIAKDATSLRDTGGVYFVPKPRMDFWRKVTRAVMAAAKHRIFKIPAMKNDEAVEAILDALTQEAEAEAKGIEAELMGDAPLGKRALTTRGTRCEVVLEKVAAYEELLGVRMPVLRERMSQLKSNLAAAALVASVETGVAA
jgi:hypothetical protein